MKEVILNSDKLDKSEINETAVRVKALLINKNNEIILGYCFNTYQFIGGHQEGDESLEECLKREIREETGIQINESKMTPFMKITHYTKNYRDNGLNRENIIYYYVIYTNEEVDNKNIDYDEWEVKGDFEIRRVNLNDIEQVLKNSIPDNPLNPLIVEEMLEVLVYYKNEYVKTLTRE